MSKKQPKVNLMVFSGLLNKGVKEFSSKDGNLIVKGSAYSYGYGKNGKCYVNFIAFGDAAQQILNMNDGGPISFIARYNTRSFSDSSGKKKWVSNFVILQLCDGTESLLSAAQTELERIATTTSPSPPLIAPQGNDDDVPF